MSNVTITTLNRRHLTRCLNTVSRNLSVVVAMTCDAGDFKNKPLTGKSFSLTQKSNNIQIKNNI